MLLNSSVLRSGVISLVIVAASCGSQQEGTAPPEQRSQALDTDPIFNETWEGGSHGWIDRSDSPPVLVSDPDAPSNTVQEISRATSGGDYFSPLVEVVAGTDADPAMLSRAAAFVRAIDKLPLPVKSAPGFLVNAVLAPYMHEAMRCVDEGIAPTTIDAAMVAFGMPMGPIELADTVGLDIVQAAGSQLTNAAEPPRCLAKHVGAGELGRKTGRGFYTYVKGKPVRQAAGAPPAGLALRLVAPLVARTRALVADGIVADADLADAGVIFGTGFAPFTGGPLTYDNNRKE